MTCPNCGLANAPNARFCANCGTALAPSVPPPSGGFNTTGAFGGNRLTPGKVAALGCLIVVVFFLFIGLSCTRACFLPRRPRIIYRRRVVYVQKYAPPVLRLSPNRKLPSQSVLD